MGNSLDLQNFYPRNSGQTPEQMFRKVRVFTAEDVQILLHAQWRSYHAVNVPKQASHLSIHSTHVINIPNEWMT